MNGFRDSEIATVSGRAFPCIGGRLRIVHELHKDKLSIETELVDYQIDQYAVVRARVSIASGGVFSATGTATAKRDPKLVDSLLELAESRACARALRLCGVGVETCGFEELGTGPALEGDLRRQALRPVPERIGGGGRLGNGHGSHHPSPASTAQRRALAAIVSRMGKDLDAVLAQAYPDQEPSDLSLSQASKLIDRLKGANGTRAGQAR